jgi:hypothetical protein
MADAKTIARAITTDKIAREIIARQTAERDAKTARLRGLRLAKEAEEAKVAAATNVASPAPKARAKRKAAS